MKKNTFAKIFFIFILPMAVCFFSSCSSSPKRPMQVTDTYNLAYTRLELANNELASSQIKKAGNHLVESYNLALSIDNAALLCRICLSGVTYKLCCDSDTIDEDKGFLTNSAEEILNEALFFSENSSDSVFLRNLCSIYSVRIALSKASESAGQNSSLLDVLSGAEKHISKDTYYSGFLQRTKGDVYMALSKYNEAALTYENAAALHLKNRYLWEIGLDWYSAARAYSLAEKKNNAVFAIESAIKYDRAAENSSALVLDYEAYSKILLKGTPSQEEQKKAQHFQSWSQRISEAQN